MLHETVPGYMVGYVMETLYNHNVYMAESDYESTVISLGYGKDNKPQYAYVEINSKI
ncbi:MAG: hypothetical protein GTN99_10695 [Candidatus Dadabacteria bacterium]|nr:hypothetical protein [Candidatus Dadabacteria bacterium]